MEDTSLEDFLDTGDESSEAESERSEAESEQTVADVPDVESAEESPDVEPAAVTASWTAGGACCDACGSEVERLWMEGETAVCSKCKNWE